MMNFDEKATQLIRILNEIPNHTYLSVLLYEKNKLINKKTNNYNNWESTYFNSGMTSDCLLFRMVEKFSEMKPHEEDTMIWDSIAEPTDSVHKHRLAKNLHHGITIILKVDDIYSFCISACADKGVKKHQFHSQFMGKFYKIRSMLRGSHV